MRWLVRGQSDVPQAQTWLADAEQRRALGLRYTKRRNEFVLRRLTAKHAVAAVIGWPTDLEALSRIEIRNEPGGAPYVLVDGEPSGLGISLTDRAGYAACAVGASPVGCDLEIVEPRSQGFIDDYLTASERAYVRRSADRDMAANLVWSAKESALKVLRTGLRRNPRSVVASIVDSRAGRWSPLSIRAEEGLVLPGWWRRDGRFLLTVASLHAGSPPENAGLPLQNAGPPPALENPASMLAAATPDESWLAQPISPAL